MNPLFQPCALPDNAVNYWAPTVFASELIKMHNVALQSGYTLRMTYPEKNASANTLNIAEIPYQNMQLGEYIVNQFVKDTGTSFQNRKSNWVLLVHMLLENTVCYMEASSEKFRQKVIATRNLALANILCGSPIKSFDIFYAILKLDYASINTIRAQHPEASAAFDTIISVMQTLQSDNYTLTDNLAKWFSGTFGADVATIKTFFNAYKVFNDGSLAEECIENKCAYIKLTADDEGNLRLPKRFTGTKYAVTMDTIMVPLQFMREQAAWLVSKLSTGTVFVQFRRDNDAVRDMLASTNSAVLQAVYKNLAPNFTATFVESRGYVRCVDICCSAVGEDFLRAISLARILSIQAIDFDANTFAEQLKPYGFHPSFATTNFSNVVPAFKDYIAKINTNIAFLQMVYKGINPLADSNANFTSPYQVENVIYQYVDMQAALTSSFARKLHLFMLNNPMLFPGYTGQPEDLSNVSISSTPRFASLGML